MPETASFLEQIACQTSSEAARRTAGRLESSEFAPEDFVA